MTESLPMKKPADIPPELWEKYEKLADLLRGYQTVVLGYSGGVDSVFLAHVCQQVLGPKKYIACLAVSPSLAKREYEEAVNNSRDLGLQVEVFQSTEFDNPDFLKNDPQRCFYCKSDLFTHLEEFRKQKGYHHILYGGNVDDLGDYRPGHRAAEKYGALAPMAIAGLTKQEIRELSRHFKLPTFNKPAMPCLSSRLPYGNEVTEKKLSMVEKAEDVLARAGFSNFRVRHEGDTARVEVPLEELSYFSNQAKAVKISGSIKETGFKRVVLDLEGLRSGNLNQDIQNS